ncbi:MAG: hypothetical protein NC084_04835 [Bacteroides sp.]|nr:hypothetical protein [Eubacterium sp.]MCM1419339.1 hypothetical protein [Roseburia sp.]MCM1462021.1 hypothetical protein [Bacteroides sp.]
MRALSVFLKVVLLILAAIWGIGCGVLFPVMILSTGAELVPEAIAADAVIVVWLATAVVGYVIPAILTLCGFYKTASVLSLLGFGGVVAVYARFAALYADTAGSNGPTELYLPCIFITILILAVTAIENRERLKSFLDRKSEEKDKPAPSIFGDSGGDEK